MFDDDDEDFSVDNFIENVMFGYNLSNTHGDKDILLKALKDQEFATMWQTNSEVRLGYSLGKNSKDENQS